MVEQKDIFTIPQAAGYCSVNRMSMWRWVKSGKIRVSVTPGGHHRISKEDLESFMIEKGMYPLAQKYFPRRKILIVDDEPSVRKALTKVLSNLKFETQTAADGFEVGIKVMQFRPDLMILDLIMAGMDGFEVCRLIKGNSSTSHIKILIFTGYDTVENKEKIMQAGADAYIVKPVDYDELFESIEKLLGYDSKLRLEKQPAKQR